MLARKGGTIAMPIEVHTEDAHEWGGYNLANPLGGFRTYSKEHYVIIAPKVAA